MTNEERGLTLMINSKTSFLIERTDYVIFMTIDSRKAYQTI